MSQKTATDSRPNSSERDLSWQAMSEWIQLKPIFKQNEEAWIGFPLFTKQNDEIIFVFGPHRQEISSILKYNTIKDECVELIKLSNEQEEEQDNGSLCLNPGNAAIDTENNILYIPGVGNVLYTINLKTQKVNNIFNNKKDKKDKEAQLLMQQNILLTIIIDNKMHIFGEYNPFSNKHENSKNHMVYDTQNCKILSQNIQEPIPLECDGAGGQAGEGMVYLKSQKKLLLIGGKFNDNIVCYDLMKNKFDVDLFGDIQLLQQEFETKAVVITKMKDTLCYLFMQNIMMMKMMILYI